MENLYQMQHYAIFSHDVNYFLVPTVSHSAYSPTSCIWKASPALLQLILHLLGAAEDAQPHQVLSILVNSK